MFENTYEEKETVDYKKFLSQPTYSRSYEQSQRAGVSADNDKSYDYKNNSQINRVKPEQLPSTQRLQDKGIPNEIFS